MTDIKNVFMDWLIQIFCPVEKKWVFLFLQSFQFSSVAQLCLTLTTPWTVAQHAPLSEGFFRQEYWTELPFPSPEDLPDPGIEPWIP